MRRIEVCLRGHDAPAGEVRVDHAARLGESLQDLVLRLTREAADAAGLGRPPRVVEQLSQVRLAGISQGSTRLQFHVGDAGSLDVDPLSGAADDMLADVIAGIATNRRPDFVTESIAEAALRLAGSLQKIARQIDVSVSGRPATRVVATAVERGVWEPPVRCASSATLVGRLEALDLNNGHFRLRDDAGNAIELIGVVNTDEAASLAGQRIDAAGYFVRAVGAGRSRLERATVLPHREGEQWRAALTAPTAPPVAGRIMRFPEGETLTDDEMDSFLESIHG